MPKEFTVKYGKDTYKMNALKGDEQDRLGIMLQPKAFGLGNLINSLITRQAIPNENHLSIYQTIEAIFNFDDWKWLVDVILYSEEHPIAVGNRYFTSKEEVDEHFAGDFVKKYAIVLQFAYKNLGEFKDLIPNLNGLVGSIAAYLEKTALAYMTEAEQSINSYGNKKTTEKKTTSKRAKKS